MAATRIAVLGAGSIGAYVGASLAAAGADVVLIGRERIRERIAAHGMLLTDLHGRRVALEAGQVPFATGMEALAGAGLVLVAVKSADTPEAARAIAAHAGPDAVVVSLQNGVGNAQVLRDALPGRTMLAGMVGFNVVQMEGGRFHRGTDGELAIEASAAIAPWLDVFSRAHLQLSQFADFASIQWGKLLLNLNNPVNALSGLPLRAQIAQRDYRRSLAILIDEARETLRAAGIRPAKVGRVGPALLPLILRLPDALFARVAAAMLRIDPEARSSMWEDLQAGRRTEVDFLNGAVVGLAESLGRDAPANRRIVALIREAENAASGSTQRRAIDGATLLAELAGEGRPGR